MPIKSDDDLDSLAAEGDALHPAIDTVAAILRALGRYPIDNNLMDTAAVREHCEQWARHILIGTPPPEVQGGGKALEDRSWDGVRRFVQRLRQAERDCVTGQLSDFRDTLWVFVQGIRGAFVENQEADSHVAEQLDRLKQALDAKSIDVLRREVMTSLVVIERTLEQRRQRQLAQMEQLGQQLKAMRAELLRAQEEMALDPMTRLYNRASFDEMLSKTVELNLFAGQRACLLMLDVDNFKDINDSYGHPAGDAVVLKLSESLVRTFPRKADFVARYAGDEFAVILQDAGAQEGRTLAERLIKVVRASAVPAGEAALHYTVSVGVAELQRDDNAARWLSRADAALYDAKERGRDCSAVAPIDHPPSS